MIEKIKVSNGLYYVAIKEANLYMQCGAPAESIKHFIKEGIVKTIQKDGVEFETGPNAILLSDNLIQNGDFANMAEFPVLHMLYKQGRIIPNHPNNDGSKPLLIGERLQLEAQLEYIYRGNYGLINKSEISQSIEDQELAQNIYQMKLLFAFGKFKKTEELLESYVVDHNYKTPIINGVYIQRVAPNIFDIIYKNEKVTIDLNLKNDEFYKSTYILPKKKIQREYFSVIHTGQGDGWDINHPSVNSVITYKGKIYLIDIVPNIRHILDSLSLDVNEIEGVFITHAHDDHVAGITYLVRSDKRIQIYAAKIVMNSLVKKVSALMSIDESSFKKYIKIKNLELESWNNLDGLEVKPMISAHPVETTLFSFRTKNKEGVYKSYGHYMDLCSYDVMESMDLPSEFINSIKKNYEEPMDIKKIDIGGGMIHGVADDFINDKSKKIIKAHTEKLLEEELISFGLIDLLISDEKDYEKALMDSLIKQNYNMFTSEEYEDFQGFEIVHFEPGVQLLSQGEILKNIYMLLCGKVTVHDKTINDIINLTAGAVIGEHLLLSCQASNYDIYTQGYVSVLKIPENYFNQLVKKYDLLDDIESKVLHRRILYKMSLFNEEVSYSNLNRIIDTLDSIKISNEIVDLDDSKVYLIVQGAIEVYKYGSHVTTLKSSDHFGGISSVLGYDTFLTYKALKDTLIYTIDAEILKEIPIVRWKVLEYFAKVNKY